MRYIAVLMLVQLNLVGLAAEESWKLPLSDKEKIIEQNIVQRHNILGLYPSQVVVPLDGAPVDNTTLGDGNIVHAVAWTSNYLAGAAYRYAVLKKSGGSAEEIAQAKKRADEIFEAVYRCQLVTGVKGFLARGYAMGHGESYEERWSESKKNEWHQGKGIYRDLRWVGDPSHHIYSATAHAMCQYYDLAAEGKMKQRVQEAMDSLVGYWADNDLKIQRYDRTLPPVRILGLTDGKTPNTRVMMAIAAAKEAYHVTGKEKYDAVYQKLIDQFGVRGLKEFQCGKDFDDGEHVYGHLENLFRIEKDPELLAAYHVVADALWAHFQDSGQSLFTYIYMGFTPEGPDRAKALKDATFRLETWPTDMTLRPTMNSLIPNLKHPYPTYLCSWDNEYIWKGNLLNLNGWTSRIVTRMAVPAEDPYVLYAIDGRGDLYQSRDGASTAAGWRPVDQGLRSAVRALDAGHKVRMIYVACGDGFYKSSTGGYTWERLPVPGDESEPVNIRVDIGNPNVLYAVTEKAVYRSRDFGEDYIGQSWQNLSEDLPIGEKISFHLAMGKPGRVYAIIDSVVFSRRLDQEQWQGGGNLAGSSIEPLPWLVIDPGEPDHAIAGVWTSFMGGNTLLRETTDGGLNWTHDIRKWWHKDDAYEQMQKVIAVLVPGRMSEPVIDPGNSNIFYRAGGSGGVLISPDGGKQWKSSSEGMEIPVANSIMAPLNTEWIFAGTPAGLTVSKDKGKTWEEGNLCLQFIKNTRRELGGAAYIDAYWRGRHYGFISE